MFKKVFNYIEDKEFKINILSNKIYISNYKKILVLEENKIVLESDNGIININGLDFKINKLFNNEILVMGKIRTLEFKWVIT